MNRPIVGRSPRSVISAVGKKLDPLTVAKVGHREILLPWTHALPSTLQGHPHYETEIERIADHLHRTDGKLVMIDVGANVGDTIARLPRLPGAKFLCVEGSKRYSDLLSLNFAHDPNVTTVCAIAAATDAAESIIKEDKQGTGHVDTTGSGTRVKTATIDTLTKRHPDFASANFLKIDTDGFDVVVLKGSRDLLTRAKPCLHVEFSPRHWRDCARVFIGDGLKLLSAHGYSEVLVYDYQGIFLARDKTDFPTTLLQLSDYALRAGTHFNLVSFHRERPDAAEFFELEQRTSLSH